MEQTTRKIFDGIAADFPEDHFLREDRSLQHDVYGVIVEMIHQNKLRPGDRVSEAAIARHLGISRGPVREAISRLDYEGLVVRRPRRGAVVSEFSVKDVEDIVIGRQLIEGQAARSACRRITAQDVAELETLIDTMRTAAATGHWTQSAALNGRFHQTVVRISDNKILAKMWQTLHPLAWLLAPVASPNTRQDSESIFTRHNALLDALRSGDPDCAESAFWQHVRESSQRTMDQLPPTVVATPAVAAHDHLHSERAPR